MTSRPTDPWAVCPSALPGSGGGHFVRCLALAEGLRELGGVATFILGDGATVWAELVRRNGHDLVRCAPQERFPPVIPASRWAGSVLDGYEFTSGAYHAWREAAPPLLVIDDLAQGPMIADVVLNQNCGFELADYERIGSRANSFLIGPRFALVRPAFSQIRQSAFKRSHPRMATRILVSLGAGDHPELVLRVMEALDRITVRLELTLALGLGSPASIERSLQSFHHAYRSIGYTNSMAKLVQDHDLVVGAAGSSCWERLCLGLPAVIMSLSPNQQRIGACLDKIGAAVCVGAPNELTVDRLAEAVADLAGDQRRRARMGNIGMGLVDGHGAIRVARAMLAAQSAFAA